MALSDLLKYLPSSSGVIILQLLGIVFRLIRAGEDESAQEEALMEADEAIKAEMDRRKFQNG